MKRKSAVILRNQEEQSIIEERKRWEETTREMIRAEVETKKLQRMESTNNVLSMWRKSTYCKAMSSKPRNKEYSVCNNRSIDKD